MKILNNPKRRFTLTREDLEYIKNIKKCIKESERKQKKEGDNDKYVTEASNKTKAMWQFINREIGKIQEDYKFELKIGNNIISDLTEITEKLKIYFTNNVAGLVKQNINKGSYNNASQEIKHGKNSILFLQSLKTKWSV